MTTENMKLSPSRIPGIGGRCHCCRGCGRACGLRAQDHGRDGPAEPEGYTWETAPEPITEVDATEETDVVVIGGGIAGFSAACFGG